ncbi:MAG: isocitrate lyase/phosphoenolpyruvate mutase family protein [Dehalococcoidia bacterium]|nr:isocitrate lyase/phosphoenolpyruvate mutase family protein [Dehalococcoidia bacterium]
MAHDPGSLAILAEKADLLRRLHGGANMLVLPNAWDAASARTFEAAGFPAIATSSNAIAASIGHEDHEHAPPDEMFAAAARITAAVNVPVTVDLEAGYQLPLDEFVRRAIAAGAAGFNFEDTDHHGSEPLVPADKQAARLAALKDEIAKSGVNLVLNARTDPLLHRTGSVDDQIADVIQRARLYREAGADCIYPFGFFDEYATRAVVKGIEGPINILAWRHPLPLAELAAIGVRRVTFASGLYREVMAPLKEMVAAFSGPYPVGK